MSLSMQSRRISPATLPCASKSSCRHQCYCNVIRGLAAAGGDASARNPEWSAIFSAHAGVRRRRPAVAGSTRRSCVRAQSVGCLWSARWKWTGFLFVNRLRLSSALDPFIANRKPDGGRRSALATSQPVPGRRPGCLRSRCPGSPSAATGRRSLPCWCPGCCRRRGSRV